MEGWNGFKIIEMENYLRSVGFKHYFPAIETLISFPCCKTSDTGDRRQNFIWTSIHK